MPFQIDTDVARPRGSESEKTAAIRELAKAPLNASVFFPKDAHKTAESLRGSVQATVSKIGGSGWASIYKLSDGVRVFKNAEPTKTEHAKLAA